MSSESLHHFGHGAGSSQVSEAEAAVQRVGDRLLRKRSGQVSKICQVETKTGSPSKLWSWRATILHLFDTPDGNKQAEQACVESEIAKRCRIMILQDWIPLIRLTHDIM